MKSLSSRQMWVLVASVMIALACPTLSNAYTLQEEIDLGAKIDTQILKENPLSTDQAAQKEIERVGQLLVKNGGLRRPQLTYHFKVLAGEDMNAFSTPGGYVYFTDHLWNVLRSDERAGVLAHEIVHADRRHALDAMLKNQRRSTILGAILIITGANRSVVDVVDVANQLYTLKYSRGDEQQADEVGTQLLYQAKMNPAGLLMAMRKIMRFQTEAGEKVPTILSSHPDTGARLQYLQQYLTKLGVPIPPENVSSKGVADKIGTVTAKSGNSVDFSSSIALKPGEILWLMGKGWDYYYENQTGRPIGRIVVTSAQAKRASGTLYTFSSAKPDEVKTATDVSALPVPPVVDSIATVPYSQTGSIDIQRKNGKALSALERLMAVAPVWDAKSSKVINDNVGYVVITNPDAARGFVAADRQKYAFAPMSAGAVLERVEDKDSSRWVGTVLSIGKSSGKVELLPNRQLSDSKTYEVVVPPWNKDVMYEQRVIATARLTPRDKNKIVMSIETFRNGADMTTIQIGFDIYEAEKAKK